MEIRRTGSWLDRVAETARLMVGVQDYARYVQHMREHHPELPVLDEGAYVALMQQRRHGGGRIGKCPC
ncbi:MAG: CstA-like transporter-associated (seleno)protein [Pseudomonadota bacterium]